MYVRLAALAAALLWASSAIAQDKTFTLTVTMSDLQVVSAGLDELQRKISQPIVEKFQKQLIPQMQPPVEPPKGQINPADAPAAPTANPHPSF